MVQKKGIVCIFGQHTLIPLTDMDIYGYIIHIHYMMKTKRKYGQIAAFYLYGYLKKEQMESGN